MGRWGLKGILLDFRGTLLSGGLQCFLFGRIASFQRPSSQSHDVEGEIVPLAAHRVTESHPSASSVDYDVAGTRVWTGPPRRRIKLHPRPHAAQVPFFLFSMRGNPVMAAGLCCSSLVVSLLVCGADQTAVSTALSMQCHVHIPEPSHPSPRAGGCREADTGGQKVWFLTSLPP